MDQLSFSPAQFAQEARQLRENETPEDRRERLKGVVSQRGTLLRSHSNSKRLVLGTTADGDSLITIKTDQNGYQHINVHTFDKILNSLDVFAEIAPTNTVEVKKPKEIDVSSFSAGAHMIDTSGNVFTILSFDNKVGQISYIGIDDTKQQQVQTKSIVELLKTVDLYAVIRAESNSDKQLEQLTNRTDATVLGEGDNSEFQKGVQIFTSESGATIVAACDIGIGYKPTESNQDRVVVDPKRNRVAVIDGVGGQQDGDEAAQLLATHLLEMGSISENVAATLQEMSQKQANNELHPNASASFIAAEIVIENNQMYIEENHCGHCNLIIFDEQGEVVIQAETDSLVAQLQSQGTITQEAALLHSLRNVIVDSVNTKQGNAAVKTTRYLVKPGYRVMLASDGITNNLTPQEISKCIKGLTTAEATLKLGDIVSSRMELAVVQHSASNDERTAVLTERRATGSYADGYKSPPKSDNRSLVLFDIV